MRHQMKEVDWLILHSLQNHGGTASIALVTGDIPRFAKKIVRSALGMEDLGYINIVKTGALSIQKTLELRDNALPLPDPQLGVRQLGILHLLQRSGGTATVVAIEIERGDAVSAVLVMAGDLKVYGYINIIKTGLSPIPTLELRDDSPPIPPSKNTEREHA